MGRLTALLLAACLSLPALAADVIKSERKEVFGDITVHYNTFASTFLQPDVAQAAELERSKEIGLINLSVLRDGKPVAAIVEGTIKDLGGKREKLAFKHVSEAGGDSYLAQYRVEQQETRTFELSVTARGQTHTFSFSQELFPGQ